MTGALHRNANLVDSLGAALREGGHALGTVPALLKKVLTEESWREFVTQRGEHVLHERFPDFVTTPPLAGLGATIEVIRRIIADDPEALDLLDQAVQNGHGGDRSKSNNVTVAPAGNSTDKALRRLRREADAGNKQAADLRAEVLAGRLSAHAAMIQGGFRPRTFTVRADSPASVAAALRRQLDPEALAELRRLLNE